MKTLKFFSFFVFLSLIIACSKDKTAPVITVTSPAEGAVLERGKTYPVVGTVTDDEELASINAGGVNITTFDSPTKHTFANFTLPIPATATVGASSFKVSATDKEGNAAEKTVNFTVK